MVVRKRYTIKTLNQNYTILLKSVHSFAGDMAHSVGGPLHFPDFHQSELWSHVVGLVERSAEWGVYFGMDTH